MKNIYSIIKKPLFTEKGGSLKEAQNKVLVEVARDANKIEIQTAIERLFKVQVLQVRTCNVLGKMKRLGRRSGKRADWKKAVVTLKEGDRIDFFEGA